MKITDLYESEFLTDKDDIIEYMKDSFVEFHPKKLKIEPDGLVYDGYLVLRRTVNKLKVQIKKVTGHFNCINTPLSSLEGFPQIVDGYFTCSNTNITSLKFCPKSVGDNFYCSNIKITDPKEYRFVLYCEIGNRFYSSHTKINDIINTYSGSINRKYWPKAINLLAQLKHV